MYLSREIHPWADKSPLNIKFSIQRDRKSLTSDLRNIILQDGPTFLHKQKREYEDFKRKVEERKVAQERKKKEEEERREEEQEKTPKEIVGKFGLDLGKVKSAIAEHNRRLNTINNEITNMYKKFGVFTGTENAKSLAQEAKELGFPED